MIPVLETARPSNVGTGRELADRKIDVHQHWRGALSQAPESLCEVCCVVAFISSIGGLKLAVVRTILKWGRHQCVRWRFESKLFTLSSAWRRHHCASRLFLI